MQRNSARLLSLAAAALLALGAAGAAFADDAGTKTVDGCGTLDARGDGIITADLDGNATVSGAGALTVNEGSDNVDVNPSGDGQGTRTELDGDDVQYTGHGEMHINGTGIDLTLTGGDLHLTADGCGTVTLDGTGSVTRNDNGNDNGNTNTNDNRDNDEQGHDSNSGGNLAHCSDGHGQDNVHNKHCD